MLRRNSGNKDLVGCVRCFRKKLDFSMVTMIASIIRDYASFFNFLTMFPEMFDERNAVL